MESPQQKMDITPLSHVHPGVYNYIICVRVSRMWEFHGKNDDEAIKHLDLVVIDQKGTAMYAEAPPDAIAVLKPQLQEYKILYMKKIIIDKAKPSYKPVRGLYMIRLNKRTEVMDVHDQAMDFPKYTFYLTPFPHLPQFERNNEYFLDVIGRIIALSDATTVSTNTGIIRMKRIIHLMDLSANKIEISLWGPRATEFEGHKVYEVGQKNHVIAIFVGTSVKSYSGCAPFLSGTGACRWYINVPDIAEITSFYTSLSDQIQPIQKIHLQRVDEMENRIEQKTLLQLKCIDPFENLTKKFECTITITKLAPKQSWCYPACTRCNSSTKYDGNTYICNKEGTVCSQIMHRYKISISGTDGTCELEFMLFDDKGTTLIGKPAEKLVKQYSRFETPPEITALIGEKMTIVAKIMPAKSISKDSDNPTFDILNIKKRHGKDMMVSLFNKQGDTSLSSTSMSQSTKLPPLIPIEPEIEDYQSPISQPLSPHDSELIRMDETSTVDQVNISHKRPLYSKNDSDKELSDDIEHLSTTMKKPKKKS